MALTLFKMIQIIKSKIERWNKAILRNLFWLVPLNFLLIIYGMGVGIYQRHKISDSQNIILGNTVLSVKNDSIFKKKMDSLDLKTQKALQLQKKIK